MANYYYYQNGGFSSYSQPTPRLPLHLLFFFLTLLLFVSLSWYLSYESVMASVMYWVRLLLIAATLGLLLAVHWISGGPGGRRSVAFFTATPEEREELHRGTGASPFYVGLLLALLLLMVSYRS